MPPRQRETRSRGDDRARGASERLLVVGYEHTDLRLRLSLSLSLHDAHSGTPPTTCSVTSGPRWAVLGSDVRWTSDVLVQSWWP
jgi:hypothetical protein